MQDQFLETIKKKAYLDDVPIMKDDGIAFLLDFLREHENIRDILECGTAVGYSSIRMAQIRWDMRIDTLEIDPSMYEQAVRNIQEAGLQERIHPYLIDAASFETDTVYDLVFVDAAKSQYRRYLEHFMKNAGKGTYFVFDNLNFHGIVDDHSLSANRSTIQMVNKIRKFREDLLADERFETKFYAQTGDGIAVAQLL